MVYQFHCINLFLLYGCNLVSKAHKIHRARHSLYCSGMDLSRIKSDEDISGKCGIINQSVTVFLVSAAAALKNEGTTRFDTSF